MANSLNIIKTLMWVLALCFVISCSSPESSTTDEDYDVAKLPNANYHPYDLNMYKLNKLVCDPLGDQGNPGINDGLVAQLFYLEQGQERYKNVQSYIENGAASSQKLFFSTLNVPTRLFDSGFPIETGGMVQDDQGNDLIEYFALKFKSVLKLSEDQEEGFYQLALLSDDGTVMKVIDEDGVKRVVVDNDKNHPTKMGCGDTLYFDHLTAYEVEIDYYQGPRYHISLIPLWRRVNDSTQAEKECGKQGNSRYFDFRNNSAPRENYTDLLLRGWEPIAAENWHLPPMAIFNPCTQGTAPKISNFMVKDIGEGVAIVTWETDIPAASQVLIIDENDNENLSLSDNILRTKHQFVFDKEIDFGKTYTFQGISISADMGKVLSRVLQQSF